MMRIARMGVVVAIAVVAAIAGGCAGGSNNNSVITGDLDLSGKVRFEKVPITSNGLDYSRGFLVPARRVLIQVELPDPDPLVPATVYDTTFTDDNGDYALTAPSTQDFELVVYSILERTGSYHAEVVDNTQASATVTAPPYAVVTTVKRQKRFRSDVTLDVEINTGWRGTGYDADARNSGIFNILDGVYRVSEAILDVDPGRNFPDLLINWSPNNVPTNGNIYAGEIGGSFYVPASYTGGQLGNHPGEIFLLGAEDIDTEEFDTYVLIHEWTHYFEDNFARSDSLGGSHWFDVDDNIPQNVDSASMLDPTVAFGEGFANALAGYIENNGLVLSTDGPLQGDVQFYIDMDLDNFAPDDVYPWNVDPLSGVGRPMDGWYSEMAVMEVLTDVLDGGTDDDDDLQVPFATFYDVFLNEQRTTPYFTSILTYLHYLRARLGAADQAELDRIAAANNIFIGATPAQPEPAEPFPYINPHTPLVVDPGVVTNDSNFISAADDDDGTPTGYELTLSHDYQIYNGLFARRFFYSGTAAAVVVRPTGANTDGDAKLEIRVPGVGVVATGPADGEVTYTFAGTPTVFSVGTDVFDDGDWDSFELIYGATTFPKANN